MRLSVLVPFVITTAITARMFAGDGIHPLPNASGYQAQQDVKTGGDKTTTLAATLVPADQVRKIFSSEIARDWIVVEVAVYPADGKSFDVDAYDFNLKIGDRTSRSENGVDVAGIGQSKTPDLRSPESRVHVNEDAGVAIGHSNYPQNNPNYPGGSNYPAGNPQGQTAPRTTVGTWESTTVTNAPPPPAPQSSSGPDARELAARLRDKELPEGITQKPVAGYLYFRTLKHKKGDPLVVQYTKGEVEADLKLPSK